MKVFIQVLFLFLVLTACQSAKEESSYHPFSITIKEHNVKLAVNAKGELFQNGNKIGAFSENKVLGVDAKVVLTLDDSNTILDHKKTKLGQLEDDGALDFEDDFLGEVKWTAKGELISNGGDNIGIQIEPNDPKLYQQASLLLFYGEYIRE
ncbi:MAG: hypothetical protein N4A35_00700 [Flavobacteriales bacterium]|nr:hypothetical protein [Flavobacteriales bacterium]